ncbi:MAG: type II toxin-antitoxin system HicA family toxin [Chitinophaga sp.]|uniref:type II toxin-antitoxin system HicA family toxin n=1 Tax=Chitinophaga sp. TaxID=1869181 RepID=UPI001AFDA74D|nr:type II toxin-antitoxin system HicA family toxin [Chitinophaga sp.]MBO9731874.1 type II toxin-antitoxin system HicA family toxin [Chitinophaga sp.]
MSKREKLIARLLSKPVDFTYAELIKLMAALGFEEETSGKTSGSRVAFINSSTKQIIRLHKPHPGNILKRYQISQLINELKNLEQL